MKNVEPRTYAFIDASNLFYGGEKSLGWKIDYQKLARYLKRKLSLNNKKEADIRNIRFMFSESILA